MARSSAGNYERGIPVAVTIASVALIIGSYGYPAPVIAYAPDNRPVVFVDRDTSAEDRQRAIDRVAPGARVEAFRVDQARRAS